MKLENIITKLQNREPRILGQEEFRKSAVLLPLIEVENEIHILFEVRSMQMRSQPGDVCFPGGKIDKEDKDPKSCAIRETTEELGIRATTIKDMVPLDYIVADSGRMIYPFIGSITNPDHIQPSEAEVEEVFTVPLNFFLQTRPDVYKVNVQVVPEEDFPYDLIVGGENYNWNTRSIDELFYTYNGKAIWGLTAKILTHFLTLLDSNSYY
ncbi:CoA pyrophosphatase [Virgibacillus sp. NKC19-3]|uniref:NUDIX hydrolase n=1 Tax=Virgibacillus saliphilus TaxID=2831674 RepID=UPI001C9B8D8F|nr:CoA pyrophosphatase [Virgibacillus sp. NKC19-3]MBY7145003.1 CoA pyrophosphatase [Virgibacillus sp. NKC19-3]